jgi:hypothetical protein
LKPLGERRHADLSGRVRQDLACSVVRSHRCASIADPGPIETSSRSKA